MTTGVSQTSTRHTPGPWKVDIRSGNLRGLSIFTDEKVGDFIADVAIHIRFKGREVAEANARLIAAAPGLLASLKEFLALRQTCIDVGGAEGSLDQQLIEKLAQMQIGVVDRAEVVIAKAEGRNV